jgi:hypothetical protein
MSFNNLVSFADNELIWSSIYVRTVEARDNEIGIYPDLTDKVLIGEDGMSVFV